MMSSETNSSSVNDDGLGEPLLVASGNPQNKTLPTGWRIMASSHAKPSIAIAALIGLGSMCVGYALGFTSPATAQLLVKNGSIPQTQGHNLSFDDHDISWFGSAVFLGALAGGLVGGPLAGYFGRRIGIMVGNALFIVGWVLIAPANNLAMLVAGRVVIGLAVGISVLVNPIYLAEVVVPELRGALTTTLQLSVSLGIVLSFGVGIALTFRQMAILGACLSGVLVVLLFALPETPRWYFRNGEKEKCVAALQKLRGTNMSVHKECEAIAARVEQEKHLPKFSVVDLKLRSVYHPLLLSVALMLFQVWSGSYAVTAYTAIIFDGAGLSDKATVVSIGVAIVQTVVTAISLFYIDRCGRRPLLMCAGSGMSLACVTMALFFYFSHRIHGTAAVALPIFAIYFYTAAYSLGLGIIPWLFMAEVFPARAKSVLSSASAAVNWLNAFLVTRFFAPLTLAIGNGGVFLLLAAVCLLLVIFTKFVLPETKNKTLEEIEDMFDPSHSPVSSDADVEQSADGNVQGTSTTTST